MLKQKLSRNTLLCFSAILLLNIFLLLAFHSRTWAPDEEGYFVHVADRILNGDILFRDIESRHAGYVHFINAGMMALFGRSFSSLRYPLLFLGILQSAIVFFLFLGESLPLAALASVTVTALGYIQSLTPNTHWYCLFFIIVMIGCVRWLPTAHRLRLPLLGFILGFIFLFRQLTAIFAGIGLLLYLLAEISDPAAPQRNNRLSRFLLLFSGSILSLYLIQSKEILSFALFGFWPCILIFWIFLRVPVSDKSAGDLVKALSFGFIAALLPMIFYQILRGSFPNWIEDTMIRAPRMLKLMPYTAWSSYALYLAGGWANLSSAQASLSIKINGLYWIFLPLLAWLNGLLVFISMIKNKQFSNQEGLSFFAVFYALVSHTLQIPIYLYYSAGLSLLGLLQITKRHFPALHRSVWLLTVFLILVGVYYHAGQSPQRGARGILEGRRETLEAADDLPRVNLFLRNEDIKTYRELIGFVQSHTTAQDPVFVFPGDPEIYFLSKRQNPFRTTLLPMTLENEKDAASFLKQLALKRPRLVIHHRGDKYNTRLTDEVVSFVKKNYALVKTLSGFDIYLLS